MSLDDLRAFAEEQGDYALDSEAHACMEAADMTGNSPKVIKHYDFLVLAARLKKAHRLMEKYDSGDGMMNATSTSRPGAD